MGVWLGHASKQMCTFKVEKCYDIMFLNSQFNKGRSHYKEIGPSTRVKKVG